LRKVFGPAYAELSSSLELNHTKVHIAEYQLSNAIKLLATNQLHQNEAFTYKNASLRKTFRKLL
jgi:hypothetical protein